MPDCYLLALSQNSALDQFTNFWSLYLLIEDVQVVIPPETKDIIIPAEIHTHWILYPEDKGVEFEIRTVHIASEKEFIDEKIFILKSDKNRHRIRISGFKIKAEGDVTLKVEWREKGSNMWNRCNASWHLNIKLLPTIDQDFNKS